MNLLHPYLELTALISSACNYNITCARLRFRALFFTDVAGSKNARLLSISKSNVHGLTGDRNHGPAMLFSSNGNGYPGLLAPANSAQYAQRNHHASTSYSRPQPPVHDLPPPIPATQVQTCCIPVPPDAVFDPNIPVKSVSCP